MKKFNDLKIGTRLNISFNVLFFLILSSLAVYSISLQKRQLLSDTETRMYEQVNDLASIIDQQVSQNQNYKEGTEYFVQTIYGSGTPFFRPKHPG
jgi:hypothetical protein